MKKVSASLQALLFTGVLAVNALANALPLNNKTTGELSDRYVNLFVPAGITFSIWGVIYILLLMMVIYGFLNKREDLSKQRYVMSLNFILNIAWIFFWHYEQVFLSWGVMLLLLGTLIKADRFTLPKALSLREKVFLVLPVHVYLGWISVATIANTTALLVSLNWQGWGLSEVFWTLFVMSAAFILAIVMLLREKNAPFALVIIWAFLGIIIKRTQNEPVYQEIVYFAYGGIAVLTVVLIVQIVRIKERKRLL